jgi:pyrimidine-nucleoside phosphorylase
MPPAKPTPAEKTFSRILKLSGLNGWSVIIIAGLSSLLALGLGELVILSACGLAIISGFMELHGRRLLKKRDAWGMRWLVRAELLLLAVLACYAITRLVSFDAGYVRDEAFPKARELCQIMGVSFDDVLRDSGLTESKILSLVKLTFMSTYATVLVVAVLYQGGMILYYRRKTEGVIEHLYVQAAPERWERPMPPPPPPAIYKLRPTKSPFSSSPFSPQDIIIKKRDGGSLSRDEIDFFAQGVTNGRFADYQATALLMAIYCRGMSPQETVWLTDAMLRSGEIMDLSSIPGAKVDKHSTGGVGDKVSLILAPLAAVCGLKVPMMSGRGLGHTGGTLDKLEAIPGFRVMLSSPELRFMLERVGCAMIGQTDKIVPADKKLYALRDVTGTVDCLPLICSSIMSKKLAEGIDSLVLDVKFGRGAFMKTKAQALELARAMVDIGKSSGKTVRAVLTGMDQPLGQAVGHTNEVIEAIEALKGRGPADLMEITYALTAHMLILGGVAPNETEARKKLAFAIASGSALERFRNLCAAQGGNPQVVDDYTLLPTAKKILEIKAPSGAAGFISEVDALKCGQAVMELGGGRLAVTDKVDYAVGLSKLVKIGEPVAPGTPLCLLHLNDDAKGIRAEALIREAIKFSPTAPIQEPLVQDLIQ